MGTTYIKQVVNTRNIPVTIESLQEGYGRVKIPPKSAKILPGEDGWAIPWATTETEFLDHHIKLAIPAKTPNPFCIWQHEDEDHGDHIRYSTDGKFHSSKHQNQGAPGTRVPGDSRVEPLIESIFGTFREIRVYTEGFVFVSRVSPLSEAGSG